jgi:hypothetical protein
VVTIKTTVEYVGFRNTLHRREYLLRAHSGPETRDFTVGIALAAFAAGRVRLQDGPEICYLKLQREIAAAVEGPAAEGDYTVSDQELAGYREAHTPARRPSPSAAATAATRPPQPASPGHS